MIEFDSYARYLTYSERDTLWSCYGTTVGRDRTEPDDDYPPHPENHPRNYFFNKRIGRTLQEFAIVYIVRGQGQLEVNGTGYRLKSGSAFFLFPGIRHWYAPDSHTGWDEYWVGFNGKEVERLYGEKFFTPDKPLFQVGIHQSLIQLFNEVIELSKSEAPSYQFNIGSTILKMISSIISMEQKHNQPEESDLLVEKAKALFAGNIQNSITVEEVAAELGLNQSRFGKLFKNYTGLTPYQYFLHMRVNRAKELLETTDCSIKELAYKLHFNDQYHFSKLFKQKTGMSPTLWLKSRGHEPH